MTRQFCDVCGEEIFGNHKFEISLKDGARILDVCHECRNEFERARIVADVETFKKLHKQ